MREKLNCPNCGAPINQDKCPYCGTVFYDFSSLKIDDINYIKLRIGSEIITFKAIIRGIQNEFGYSDETLYMEDLNGLSERIYYTQTPSLRQVHIDFEIV